MTIYAWGVTVGEVLQAAGHPDPGSPTLPTSTSTSGFITRAATRVNSVYKRFTGATAAAGIETSYEEAYQLGRTIVLHLAASEWLLSNQAGTSFEFADRLREMAIGPDGRSGEIEELRRLLSTARSTLAPTAGPAESVTTRASRVPWVSKAGGWQ